MSFTPATVPGRVGAGIDWAKDDHAVCILDVDGSVLDRFFVTHDAAGLRSLVRRLLKAGVDEVGIERGDGPVIDALLQAEITTLVIAPGQLKNLRSRYGSAGNKDDRFDAYVLADVVRTDRHRLRPLVRDTAATTAMRTTVRARRDWSHTESPLRTSSAPTCNSSPRRSKPVRRHRHRHHSALSSGSPPRPRPTGSRSSALPPGCARSPTGGAPAPRSCTRDCSPRPAEPPVPTPRSTPRPRAPTRRSCAS